MGGEAGSQFGTTSQEILNDPALIMQVLGMVTPSIVRNNSVIRPGAVLSSLGQLYENMGNQQHFNAAMDKLSQGAQTPGSDQPIVGVNAATDLEGSSFQPNVNLEKAKQLVSLSPPSFGSMWTSLSPREKRAVMQRRGGADFDRMFGLIQSGAEQDIARKRDLALRDVARQIAVDPTNPELHQAAIMLTRNPEGEAVNFGKMAGLSQIFKKSGAFKDESEVRTAALLPEWGFSTMKTRAINTSLLAGLTDPATGKPKAGVDPGMFEYLQHAASSDVPIPESLALKGVQDASLKHQLDQALRDPDFPEIRALYNSRTPIPDKPEAGQRSAADVFSALQQKYPMSVVQYFQDRQDKMTETDFRHRHITTQEEQAKAAQESLAESRRQTGLIREGQLATRRLEYQNHLSRTLYDASRRAGDDLKALTAYKASPGVLGTKKPGMTDGQWTDWLENNDPSYGQLSLRYRQATQRERDAQITHDLEVDPAGLYYQDQRQYQDALNSIVSSNASPQEKQDKLKKLKRDLDINWEIYGRKLEQKNVPWRTDVYQKFSSHDPQKPGLIDQALQTLMSVPLAPPVPPHDQSKRAAVEQAKRRGLLPPTATEADVISPRDLVPSLTPNFAIEKPETQRATQEQTRRALDAEAQRMFQVPSFAQLSPFQQRTIIENLSRQSR